MTDKVHASPQCYNKSCLVNSAQKRLEMTIGVRTISPPPLHAL